MKDANAASCGVFGEHRKLPCIIVASEIINVFGGG
jgi:hypothetical protein